MSEQLVQHHGVLRDGQRMEKPPAHPVILVSADPDFRGHIDADGVIHSNKMTRVALSYLSGIRAGDD